MNKQHKLLTNKSGHVLVTEMASAVSSGFRPPGANPNAGLGASGGLTTPGGSNPGAGGQPGGSSGLGLGLSGIMGGSSNFKPVPMKLFATWEVDRTPPNCIPR